ncbi:MAG TPA: lytic transglycosylase domain-containing protein [Aliiroseovarius sp.]|nr:lytic transglycosylase domain-containing protein [Aliiroseovarius sp.]
MIDIFARVVRVLAILLVTALTPTLALSAENPAFVSTLSEGLERMRAGEWDEALEAAGPENTIRRDIIEWHRLRASRGTFAETLAFLARRPNWPGLKLLRKRSEASIPADADPDIVRAFFARQAPQTGTGALRLAQALTAQGEHEQAKAQVVLAWFSTPMLESEEQAILAEYGDAVRPYHQARLDMLLWRGLTKDARQMLPRVDAAYQKLALARIGLRSNADGVNALIDAVPASLASDPGLAYERFLWRARKGRNQDAIDLLLTQSANDDTLGDPARWGSWRRTLARWSMREGKARQAYRIAAGHHIAEGSNRNDLEWLAGYIALRKLDDPATALKHFQAFRNGVDSPISLGRAGYWLGRAYEAMGQSAKAQEAYRFGARYQTSFYGQLAAEKAGVAMDPKLTGQEVYSGWEQARFWGDSNMVAGRLLQAAGERYLALRFTQQMSETLTRQENGQLLAWAEDVDAPYLQVKLAKYILKTQGLMFERPYFAVTKLGRARDGVPAELALSIARRESEFNPTVESGVGARGMMQLMPQTARDMAKQLGLDYSYDRLITDPVYNIKLGKEYLAYLYGEFGQNPIIIAAAYNAGPTRARRWISQNGHPGARTVDAVDWIEHIPFRETRNYVMRVTESLAAYRARLSGRISPLRLSRDIESR